MIRLIAEKGVGVLEQQREMLSSHLMGDLCLTYYRDQKTDCVGMELAPAARKKDVVEKERCQLEPLVQAKLVGDIYPTGFSQGRTMRNSETVDQMRYVGQREEDGVIITELRNGRGVRYIHRVSRRAGSPCVEVVTEVVNGSQETITLEMLSSFTLGGLTPFAPGDAEETLLLHRLVSSWSAEGRMKTQTLEELGLEPSWACSSANSIRWHQTGSMPVREYFPIAALEDTAAGVTWAVELTHGSSWQLEAYRRDSGLSLSGGLADRECGHWMKRLYAGESFTAPRAVLTACAGGANEAMQRLVENMRPAVEAQLPPSERDMPVIFNEFCTTWGNPCQERVEQLAAGLARHGARYFVIDAGWYADPVKGWGSNLGEWIPNEGQFPRGIKAAADAIRAQGMIPGLWFELEMCGESAVTFGWLDQLLQRDGLPVTNGCRRFWDMNNPEVVSYLEKRVIGLLKENGFGYIKIDYNETIGIGCENPDSLGEGLRRQIEGTQRFFREIRRQIPDIVIENCASGGHRLVPSFLEITSMSSFSDAHECPEIPVIAANLHRAVLPRQSQIWAVLHPEQTLQRVHYQMASTFLGRCCLSGGVDRLSEEQWAAVEQGIALYHRAAPVIDKGFSRRGGDEPRSYRHLKGWQYVARTGFEGEAALVVLHSFAGAPETVSVPLQGNMKIEELYAREGIAAKVENGSLTVSGLKDFDGVAVYLT